MRGDGKFSEDWHRLYDRVGRSSFDDRDLLTHLEEQLGQYESIWNQFNQIDVEAMQRFDESTLRGHLRQATFNVNLLARLVLWRTINLLRAFMGAMNRDDFESAPFLLRSLLEQAAFGVHAARRVRLALTKFRTNDPRGESIFVETQDNLLLGARVNFGALLREVQKLGPAGKAFGNDFSELNIVKQLVERGEFRKISSPDEARFKARSVAEMVDVLASENLIEGAPPNALRDVWEYLSQYCHPSAFAWGFYLTEAARGGEPSASQEQPSMLVYQRCMALERFIEPASWVAPLSMRSVQELVETQSELARESDAVGSVP